MHINGGSVDLGSNRRCSSLRSCHSSNSLMYRRIDGSKLCEITKSPLAHLDYLLLEYDGVSLASRPISHPNFLRNDT